MKLKSCISMIIFNINLMVGAQGLADSTITAPSISGQTVLPSNSTLFSHQLLENILINQSLPQKLMSMAERADAVKSQADTWLAGEIRLLAKHDNDSWDGNREAQNWEFGVSFPFQRQQKRLGLSRLAHSYRALLPSERQYVRWQASGFLRKLIWQLRYAQAEQQLAQSALQQGLLLVDKVTTKVNAGESPLLDQLLAEKQLLAKKNKIINQDAKLEQLASQFKIWTSYNFLPLDYIESVADPLPINEHPRVNQILSQYQLSLSQQHLINLNKKSNPDIAIGFKHDRDKNTNNTGLFFELSIPIQSAPNYSLKQAEHRISMQNQQSKLKRVSLEVQADIEKKLKQLNAEQQGIALLKQQLKLSRQALRMSENAYQLGENNIQNLLLVQQQSLEAEGNLVLAQIKLNQAISEVNQARGHLIGEQK